MYLTGSVKVIEQSGESTSKNGMLVKKYKVYVYQRSRQIPQGSRISWQLHVYGDPNDPNWNNLQNGVIVVGNYELAWYGQNTIILSARLMDLGVRKLIKPGQNQSSTNQTQPLVNNETTQNVQNTRKPSNEMPSNMMQDAFELDDIEEPVLDEESFEADSEDELESIVSEILSQID